MDKFKFSVVHNKEVSKATLISDLKHFVEAFENSKNTAFEYVTDSAIFKVERINNDDSVSVAPFSQFGCVDAAGHATN